MKHLLVSLIMTSAPLLADLAVPPGLCIQAALSAGQGNATLTTGRTEIRLAGKADKPGPFVENTRLAATVFDFLLEKPVDLPPDTNRIRFEYRLPRGENQGLPGLRVLVKDRRGGVWAVGTRLGANLSHLPVSQDFRPVESFAFDVSELGRIDPWVMMSLDPAKHDEYDAPLPPFHLAGFRVVIEDAPPANSFLIEVRDIRALGARQAPDPYWTLIPQRAWSLRQGHMNPPYSGEYGWGIENRRPCIKLPALNLPGGKYCVAWEILDARGWKVLASKTSRGAFSETDRLLELPLLPADTYQLHLFVQPEGAEEFREFFFTYVVLRNSQAVGDETEPLTKPLRFESGANGLFEMGSEPKIVLRAMDAPGKIRWKAEAADGRLLGNGEADSPFELDLSQWRENAIWISASLIRDGQPVDVGRRVAGFPAVAPLPAPKAGEQRQNKLDQAFADKFQRTKGDWYEGETSIAAQSAKALSSFGPWLKEAGESGYNLVELSAPWDDLNPLPGVYQFEYLDKLVAEAKKRNLHVVLRVHPLVNSTPPWVKFELLQDEGGFAHGLWFGGNVLIHSPASVPMRKALTDYLTALASHYRDTPTVVGYTLSSLFFDHDLVDMPWMGQSVDYSEASRSAFQGALKASYGNELSNLNRAWQTDYRAWGDIPIPRPKASRDDEGRLMPRTDAPWVDWSKFKLDSIRSFRLGTAEALRSGDPACWVGLYSSDTSPLYIQEIAEKGYWVTFGSMEAQFPPEPSELHGRHEPHAKIARSAALVDVGMTNILMANPPGHDGFFNYWMPEWRNCSITPQEQEAENRLKQWFGSVDRLVGAKPVSRSPEEKSGAFLISKHDQLTLLQHVFMGRTEDYLKPWFYRMGADEVSVKEIDWRPGALSDLSKYPFIYVPYSTTGLDGAGIESLVRYAHSGGRVILEATSGFWSGKSSNALGTAFELPVAKPVSEKPQGETESAKWKNGSPLQGALGFRVREFKPPINDQLTPWIHNIPRAFLRSYRLSGPLPPKAEVLAEFPDGSPAVVRIPVGKGEVLFFTGVIDWLGAPGLAKAIDAWGRGESRAAENKGAPEILTQTLAKDDSLFAIGRRFMGQSEIERLKTSQSEQTAPKHSLSVKFATAVPGTKYQVTELLSGRDLGRFSPEELTTQGVPLELSSGEAFILQARSK